MADIDKNHKLNIISCGILADEVKFLISKNRWDIDPVFLSSSLHISFSKLEKALCGTLSMKNRSRTAVVYGTCHPDIDKIVNEKGALRTDGQNCVELLLGRQIFTEYLSEGAFFLMEEWVKKWDEVMELAFGCNNGIICEILKAEHKFFLGINTPCSGDFREEAEDLSRRIGLPLKWHTANLLHLEKSILLVLKKLENGIEK